MKLVNKRNASLVLNNLQVADTLFKRLKGLLGYDQLPRDFGLLFPKCNMIHMIGMRFPIDVVFLDEKGKVLKIFYSYQPGRIMLWPISQAYYTLELPSGLCKEKDIKEGDLLEWVD